MGHANLSFYWLRAGMLALAAAVLSFAPAGAAERDAASRVAQAEGPTQGRVLSFACGSIPKDAAFEIEPYSDDDLSIATAGAFAAELSKKEHRVRPDARFAVLIDTRIELGRLETPPGTLGRLKIKGGGVEVRLNIWSSTKDSLLAGRRGRAIREPTRLLITATLRDRETGKALWHGEAVGELGGAQPVAVSRALVPALAEAFGCSLRLGDIALPEE